jgi:hypothetical protein
LYLFVRKLLTGHLAGLDLLHWLSAGLSLAQLLSIAAAPTAAFQEEQDDLSAVCTICGAEVERYSPEGIAYCAEHFPGHEAGGSAPMTYEQFMAAVRRIAAVFPGGCTVHVDPPGYTLEEHGRREARRGPCEKRVRWYW